MPQWLYFVIGLLVMGAYVAFYSRGRRSAARKIARECDARGWTFLSVDPALGDYSGWPFDAKGARRRAVVRGRARGRDFTAYELSIHVGIESKDSDDGLLRNRCRFHVVAVQHGVPAVPDADIPPRESVEWVSQRLFEHVGEALPGRPGEAESVLPAGSPLPLKFESGAIVTYRTGPLVLADVERVVTTLNDIADRLG